MDQNRETLRANIFCVTFECERDQRNLFIRAAAIQANNFVLFGHGFSNLYYVIASITIAGKRRYSMREGAFPDARPELVEGKQSP